MALPTDLLTNEVKDRAGAEVEFEHLSLDGREHLYKKKGAAPNQPVILRIAHQVNGTGIEAVRRSVVRVDATLTGASGKPRNMFVQKTWSIPEGDLADLNLAKDLSAMIDSFCATTGAATTVLFDGSGSGDSAGINGTV